MLHPSRRYHVTTFGCQMNKADSERMASILEVMSYECRGSSSSRTVTYVNS